MFSAGAALDTIIMGEVQDEESDSSERGTYKSAPNRQVDGNRRGPVRCNATIPSFFTCKYML